MVVMVMMMMIPIKATILGDHNNTRLVAISAIEAVMMVMMVVVLKKLSDLNMGAGTSGRTVNRFQDSRCIRNWVQEVGIGLDLQHFRRVGSCGLRTV